MICRWLCLLQRRACKLISRAIRWHSQARCVHLHSSTFNEIPENLFKPYNLVSLQISPGCEEPQQRCSSLSQKSCGYDGLGKQLQKLLIGALILQWLGSHKSCETVASPFDIHLIGHSIKTGLPGVFQIVRQGSLGHCTPDLECDMEVFVGSFGILTLNCFDCWNHWSVVPRKKAKGRRCQNFANLLVLAAELALETKACEQLLDPPDEICQPTTPARTELNAFSFLQGKLSHTMMACEARKPSWSLKSLAWLLWMTCPADDRDHDDRHNCTGYVLGWKVCAHVL